MWAFMTTGTTHFLKSLADSNPKTNFHFMKEDTSTLVYYESNRKKGLFVSGRSYNITYQEGDIRQEGFIVMNNIPINEDSIPIFENQTEKQLTMMENVEGLICKRLLKPLKGNVYVVFTQWAFEKDYIHWQNSKEYAQTNFENSNRLPAYFANRPFTSTYYLMKDEE